MKAPKGLKIFYLRINKTFKQIYNYFLVILYDQMHTYLRKMSVVFSFFIVKIINPRVYQKIFSLILFFYLFSFNICRFLLSLFTYIIRPFFVIYYKLLQIDLKKKEEIKNSWFILSLTTKLRKKKKKWKKKIKHIFVFRNIYNFN
jgi:hypothetical protein